MSLADLAEQMAAAGAPLEAIILALRAVEAKDGELAAKRAGAAERKRRERAKRDGPATVTRQSQDNSDLSPDPLSLFPETKTVSPAPPSEKTQTNLPNPSPPIVPRSPRTAFEAFWEAWAPKVSKGQAETTFAKVIKTVDFETIMAGVARTPADRRWLDGCPPHASTWLNAKGWLDEPSNVLEFRATGPPLSAGERQAAMREEVIRRLKEEPEVVES